MTPARACEWAFLSSPWRGACDTARMDQDRQRGITRGLYAFAALAAVVNVGLYWRAGLTVQSVVWVLIAAGWIVGLIWQSRKR